MPGLTPDSAIVLFVVLLLLTAVVPFGVGAVLYMLQKRLGAVDLKCPAVLFIMTFLCILVTLLRKTVRDLIPKGVFGVSYGERWLPVCLLVQVAATGVLAYWALRAWEKLRSIDKSHQARDRR